MKTTTKNLVEEEIDEMIEMLKAYMESFDELHAIYHNPPMVATIQQKPNSLYDA